jgi:MT0933-like antitoxin protein
MGLDELKDKAEGFIRDHAEQIEDGVEKAGDFAKSKLGHDEQVDKAVDKINDVLPRGE